MSGNNGKGIVLQERDRHLLRELALMRVVDRAQAQIVGPFGSVTRAKSRLLGLTRAGFLQRFFLGTEGGGKKAVYMLSPPGARLVGARPTGVRRAREGTVVADIFVAHQFLVNDLYCDFKYGTSVPQALRFSQWQSFSAPFDRSVPLIPDGYVEFEGTPNALAAFIEVDRAHERLSVWREKVRHYLEYAVSGLFPRQFSQNRFLVLAVCETPGRVETIRATTASLTDKIFRFTTFPLVRQHGMWSPIWLKPRGDEPESLVEIP